VWIGASGFVVDGVAIVAFATVVAGAVVVGDIGPPLIGDETVVGRYSVAPPGSSWVARCLSSELGAH